MASENKKYAVIKFLSDSTFSEIPTAWLTEKDGIEYCWWPPRTANSATLISKCASPNYKTWTLHKVDFIRYCASLESARKCAADSTYETADEEQLGRGKRQHISYNPYGDDEEEEDEADNPVPRKNAKKKQIYTGAVSALPSVPPNLELSEFYASSNNTNAITAIAISDQPLHISSQEEQTSNAIPIVLEEYTSLATDMQNFNMKESVKQMLRIQAASNITLKEMNQRLIKIEGAVKRHAQDPSGIDDHIIAPFLPLATIENVKEFDSLLKKSEESVQQFKQLLLKTGGYNAKDNIHRSLKKIFTNECAMKCSWKGVRNNFRVSNLHFIKIMKRQVTSQYSTFTETDFDCITSEWLRFAKQRKKREESKENKVAEDNTQE